MSQNVFLFLTAYVVNAVWQVAVLAAAGWGLSRWLRPKGPELEHKVWVATLILATLVPATPVLRSYLAHGAATGAASASSPAMVAGLSGPHIPLTGSDLIFHPIALYLVSGLYFATLLFGFLRLCWMLQRTEALVRNAAAASTEPDSVELWRAWKERLSAQSPALRQSREIRGPVTAGLWRPVLLLPATFLGDYSQSEFLAAIAHECAHIERNDFRKNVLYEIVSLATVFHPLTWFIKSQIAQTREMVCDRIAAEQLEDRRTYAHSLLRLAGKMQTATLAVSPAMGMFDSRILERRIVALATSAPRLSRIQRSLWSVTAILVLTVCAGGFGLMTRTVAAQTAELSSQAPTPAARKPAAPDLSCTYYHNGDGSEGTCGYDKHDQTKYRCYSNADPKESNEQVGCGWKLQRAAASNK